MQEIEKIVRIAGLRSCNRLERIIPVRDGISILVASCYYRNLPWLLFLLLLLPCENTFRPRVFCDTWGS